MWRLVGTNTASGGDNRALEISWLAVIFLIPLFFNPAGHQICYLNKALLLQFLVFVMLAAVVADSVRRPVVLPDSKWRCLSSHPLHLAVLAFAFVAVISTVASLTPAMSFWGIYTRKTGLLTTIC
ncbi:MAG: hypothetical protein KAU10_07160, partial [Dehalococcoidia bacterium]|nr:hypothetical protein [Dehalococcoidia bacterium]